MYKSQRYLIANIYSSKTEHIAQIHNIQIEIHRNTRLICQNHRTTLSANYNVTTINTSKTLRNNQQSSAGTIYKHVINN